MRMTHWRPKEGRKRDFNPRISSRPTILLNTLTKHLLFFAFSNNAVITDVLNHMTSGSSQLCHPSFKKAQTNCFIVRFEWDCLKAISIFMINIISRGQRAVEMGVGEGDSLRRSSSMGKLQKSSCKSLTKFHIVFFLERRRISLSQSMCKDMMLTGFVPPHVCTCVHMCTHTHTHRRGR